MDLGAFGIWWSGWRGDDGLEEAAAELERLGYGAIWMSGGFSPGLLPRFERTLAASSSVVVASGIVNTWLTPASALAASVAALEETHAGRFLLGIGVSHAPVVEGSGQSYERPYSQMVGFLGDLDAADPTVPKQRRVLAALGPKMLEVSAERSLGAHPYFVTVEHTRFAREVLGDGPLLAPEVAVVLEEDAATARAAARQYMSLYLGLPNYVGNLRRTGWSEEDVSDGGSDRLVDALVPWGDAQAVADRVAEHRDAGADHVCIQVVGGDGTFPLASYLELGAALGLG